MESNVVDIQSLMGERWFIIVDKERKPSISCSYDTNCDPHWTGLIFVQSLDALPAALGRARNAMRTARKQNVYVEVPV